MQYKANLPENQVNASSVLAKGYEAVIVFWPKNPKANFLNGKMNISYAITKDYENVRLHRRGETKPNSNPIKAKTNPIQTQFKAKTNPIFLNMLIYAIYKTAISLDKSTENAHPQDRQSEIGNRKSKFIPKSPIIARNQRWKFISIPLTLYPKLCYLLKNSILNSKPVLIAAEGFNILNSKSVNFGYLPDCFVSCLF